MMTCGKMWGSSCRQEFTLEDEEDAGPDTEMERGQLLTLSALSSHSLPVAASGNSDGALQPVSREATLELTQDTSSTKPASGYDAVDDDEQVAARDMHGEKTQTSAI